MKVKVQASTNLKLGWRARFTRQTWTGLFKQRTDGEADIPKAVIYAKIYMESFWTMIYYSLIADV